MAQADEATSLGSIAGSAINPYLNVELIVNTARERHADAVHPGYGYLSENADFADAVRRANLIFVGPDRFAMSTLGDKRAAKDYLQQKAPEVPLIPGFSGTSQSITELEQAAEDIGYPVMVKASAGGGGKGLKVAYNQRELKDALERAKSEAERSFGSSDCILEKYIDAGKHIEMQIVGDQHGFVACFWERDCSLQRRNQKIIEETPCAWLTPEKRKSMRASAVRIAKLIQYEGAGTVEFIVDVKTGDYHFLEVNARLQVEHPITEEVTGFDLVALQLYVAAGGKLEALTPIHDIRQTGHAIECRLYAERPADDFVPASGTVYDWHPAPSAKLNTRFETAIRSGSEVSVYFDPMIAKIVVWAPSRENAIHDMISVLRNTSCIGVQTNQLFMQACLLHSSFYDPSYTTSFIPSNLGELLVNPYSKLEPKIFRTLPLLPALYFEAIEKPSQSPTVSAFRHLPSRFRNLHSSFNNQGIRIITVLEDKTPGLASLPMVVHIPTLPPGHLGPRKVALGELPKVDVTPSTGEKYSKQSDTRATIYNVLSNHIRSNAIAKWPSCEVIDTSVRPISGGMRSQDLQSVMLNGVSDLSVSIEGLKIHARAFAQSHGAQAEARDLYCHLPAIGTWTSWRCDTLLGFFSRKDGSEHSMQGVDDDQEIIKAPMPCKVLAILKNKEERVKAGEAVIVIESMKMETNICSQREGCFQPLVAPEQAVSKGESLCRIV